MDKSQFWVVKPSTLPKSEQRKQALERIRATNGTTNGTFSLGKLLAKAGVTVGKFRK